jgi:hypothetical protein
MTDFGEMLKVYIVATAALIAMLIGSLAGCSTQGCEGSGAEATWEHRTAA